MRYTATAVEIKTPDWKIITAVGLDGIEITDGSLNRKDKKTGAEFPHYNEIVEGFSFEADTWHNPSGKWYFFPPKVKTAFKRDPSAITKAMETKKANIDEFQEKKQDAIKMAGAMRDATLISLASMRDQPFPMDEEYKAEWTKWYKWLLNQGDQPFV